MIKHRKSCFSAKVRITLFLLLFFLNTVYVYCGTTGKISGNIKNKSTNQSLIGANIVVKELQLGAASDKDGYYYILNIPPGDYTVSAMMIGYETLTKTNVKVSADYTTNLDFELTETVLKGQEVMVIAEKPLIQRDATAKQVVVESESFADMPITTFEGVLTTQAGFTTDENNEIHVRGGRSGEIAYMIDGIYVRDPYSGGFGSQLDKYSIEELQIITGGYNAEYGQAMSGVINIITKEGSNEYHGRLEYESLRINESPFRKKDWLLDTYNDTVDYHDIIRDSLDQSIYSKPVYDKKEIPQYISLVTGDTIPAHKNLGYIPIPGNFSANFSGPIPFTKNITFFVSARKNNDRGYLPWEYDKRQEYNGKLTFRLNQIKLNLFVQRNYRQWKPYSHRWKYNPEGYEHRKNSVKREGLTITHTLSNSIFYEVFLSRFTRKYDRFQPEKQFNYYPEIDSIGHTDFVRNTTSNSFYISGDNGTIEDRDILTLTGKFVFISQINRQNLIKTGIEIIQHEISREYYIQPWEGDHHRYEKFLGRKPVELSAFFQDKLEHNQFIINLGLRYDYSDPKHPMWPDLDLPGYIDTTTGDWIASEEVEMEPKTLLSPRIGVGFPVTDKTLFYSSYGHFYQIPGYLEMYGSHKVDEDRPLIGNPAINPQKTVAFEAGVRHQLRLDYVFDFNIYFKDITNLAGSTYHGYFPYEYTLYDNSDYASVNGLDITLTRRFSNYFSADLNYSFAVAKGNESDPREGFNDYKRSNFPLRPKRLYYLDFDQRHDFAFNLNLIYPKKFGPGLLGLHPFGNLQFNILFEVASGLPYTPIVEAGGEGSLRVEKNSAHRPPTTNLDMKILKKINVGGYYLTGFLVVKNVFDRRNTISVWSRTGLPWDAGPLSSNVKDRIFNPNNVSEPRNISIGVRLDI